MVRHWRSGEQPGGGVPTSCPRKTLHAEQASLSAGRLQPPASRPRTLPSAELQGRGASHRTPLFQPRVTSLERSARRIVGRAAPVRLGEEGGVATRRPEVPVIVQGNAGPSCPPLLVGAPGVVRDQVGEEGPVGVGEGRACVPGQPPACSLQGQSETQGGCWGPGSHKARLPQAGLGVICKQARPGGRALGLHGGGQGGRWGPSPPAGGTAAPRQECARGSWTGGHDVHHTLTQVCPNPERHAHGARSPSEARGLPACPPAAHVCPASQHRGPAFPKLFPRLPPEGLGFAVGSENPVPGLCS